VSLRWRIALALAVLAAFVAGTVSVTSYVATRTRLYDEIDTSLAEAARAIAPPRLARGRPRVPELGIGPLGQFAVQVLDEDGAVRDRGEVALPVSDADRALASSGRAGETRTVDVDDTPYRLSTVALPGGGAVQVARDLSETERVLGSLRRRFAVLGLGVVVVAAGVGWFVAQRTTRSLRRFSGAVEEVTTTGRLDVGVPDEGTDEVGRLAAAFNEMVAALARSRDEQRRLVQDAGHELRTPLTSLRTNAALLERLDALTPDERRQLLDDVRLEVEELVTMANELIELAIVGVDPEPEQDVALDELVERVAVRARRRVGGAVSTHAEPTRVRARPVALERAVSNLVDNAAKFGGDGPVEISVRGTRVEVRDHGAGIPDGDLPHVFDRFYRAISARDCPGSGLGLSIVRDTVVAHGGEVFARNDPDGGVVVGFELP